MGAYDSELYKIGYRFKSAQHVKSDLEIAQDQERARLVAINFKIMKLRRKEPWTQNSTCFYDFETERKRFGL